MLNGIYSVLRVLVAMCCCVEETPDTRPMPENRGRPTLGGTQYWTDHLVCQQWRIQHHVKFGQFRLLTPSNRVAETGKYETCRQAFDVVRSQADFPPIPATVLVSVHGLGRTRNSMTAIGKHVSDQGDLGWINFGYASTRSDIAGNARALRHVLDELAQLKLAQDAQVAATVDRPSGIQFHFIAHSLGNILIRQMLSEVEREDPDRSRTTWGVGRIVMLGPPNQGSAMANLLQHSTAFRWIAGSSGTDLGAEWNTLQQRLVVPPGEFAIIAGGKSDERGYNPLLSGDDDLIVRVEETKLSGAADFAVIPSVHTLIMDRPEAKEMALRFLQHGFLKAADQRQRIP